MGIEVAKPRAGSNSSSKLRIAVVGCGEVTRRFHLPVLSGHSEVEVAALIDLDEDRAARLAGRYSVKRVYREVSELPANSVDAAMVCTAPGAHASVSLELMRRGIHVLVEKPMATDAADADAMVSAAEQAGVVLCVALHRRLLRSTQLARALVHSQWLGVPIRFDHREGGVYDWPAATLCSMEKRLAGGGVLIDCGSHVLDLLAFICDSEGQLVEYRDNCVGGVESDATVNLHYRFRERPIFGVIELSRTRRLRNTLQIECERGVIELELYPPHRLKVLPENLELTDAGAGARGDVDVELRWARENEPSPFEPYRVMLDDFLGAISRGRAPALSGRSVLPTMRLIDACYRARGRLEEPGLERPPLTTTASFRRVLVTGATGFLGSRVAELLQSNLGWNVRAAVHNPGNASRVARLPVELVPLDLRRSDDVFRAVAECDAVVHCAIGANRAGRSDVFAVTVEGTRKLVEAALAADVRRFVLISSIAVYGLVPGMTIDGTTPLKPCPGDVYAESKAAAEQVVRGAAQKGLRAVILRPTRIYGPFSNPFIVDPLRRLRDGKLAVSRAAVGAPSQTVFLDNVVAAIVRALEAPEDAVVGRAFVVGDGEDVTWDAFYRFFADAAGLPMPIVDDRSSTMPPAGEPSAPDGASLWRALVELSASREFLALANRVLRTDPLGTPLRRLLDAHPRLRGALLDWASSDALVYARTDSDDSPSEIVRPVEASIDLHDAEAVLGYRSVVPREVAMQRTLSWVRYAEILPDRPH